MSLLGKLRKRIEQRSAADAATSGIEMLREWEIEHVSGAEWVLTHSRFERSDSYYRYVNTYEWQEFEPDG